MEGSAPYKDKDLESAKETLVGELGSWFDEVRSRHQGTRWPKSHDAGTYLTSFRELFLLRPDTPGAMDFIKERHLESTKWLGRLPDGYHGRQEVHHGVEHFVIFLAWLRELLPADTEVKAQLASAARHIVEKGRRRKPWYDAETNRFPSTWLGSKAVGKEGLNIIEHLRLVRLAWLGIDGLKKPGGESTTARLRDFIEAYSLAWATAVVDGGPDELPLYLDGKGDELKAKLFKKALSMFMGAAPKSSAREARAEIHVANGTPGLFMALHAETGKKIYLDAAATIIGVVLEQLRSPYAHPIGELAWAVHQAGGIERDAIVRAVEEFVGKAEARPSKGDTVLLLDKPDWSKRPDLKNTVGMRRDMPEVAIKRNGVPTAVPPSPGSLVLAARVTKDDSYLATALNMATAVLECARQIYDDGHGHGCASNTVSAACVGHGRNWGSGYVSTALRGLIDGCDVGISLPSLK